MTNKLSIAVSDRFGIRRPVIEAALTQLLEISGWRSDRNLRPTIVGYGIEAQISLPCVEPDQWTDPSNCLPVEKDGLLIPDGALLKNGDVDWVFVGHFFLAGQHEWAIDDDGTRRRLPDVAVLKWGLERIRTVEVAADKLSAALRKLRDIPPPSRRWPTGKKWAFSLSHDCDRIYRYRPRTYFKEAISWAKQGDARMLTLQSAKGIYSTVIQPFRRDPCLVAWQELIAWASRMSIPSATYIGVWSRFDPDSHADDLHYDYRDKNLARSVRTLFDQGQEVGLHFSIRAEAKKGQLLREVARFEEAFGRKPEGARAHFWSLNAAKPEATLKELFNEAGFLYDSSLGMNWKTGFRRGIGYPFRPSDPETGEMFDGIEIPPVAMDEALYLSGDDPDSRRARFKELVDEARRNGGHVTLDWHTDAFLPGFLDNHLIDLVPVLEDLRGDPECWIASPGEIARWARTDRWHP